MRRRLLYHTKSETTSPVLGMDVLFFNSETHEHSICDHTKYDITNWPVNKFIPIGIVAIPESHNRYSGKYVGVVALDNATTIQSDPSMTSVIWGGRDTSIDYDGIFNPLITPLEDGLAYLKYNGYEGTVYDSFQGTYSASETFFDYPTVGMPSDAYMDENGYSNPLDTKTKYSSGLWGAMDGKYCQAPSPYCYTDSIDTYSLLYDNGNVGNYSQCDRFNGEEICWEYLKKMTDIAYCYRGWLEDEEIANIQMMMPAMEACWRYAPEGSAEGCWHLPTSAEFAYVISRAESINNTISQLNSIYGTSGTEISLTSNTTYLTSILANDTNNHYQYAIAHRNHGYTGFEVDLNAICRPMKKVYTAGVTNGVIGYETIPTYQNDDSYYSHWGVYRHENAIDGDWGSENISGTVYGVRIKSFNDWTVIRDNVPLLTFSNIGTDYYNNSVQFGDYDDNAEPGWYLVRHISLSNGNIIRNINQNLIIDADWTGITINKDSWEGTISTCYKFDNMRNRDNGIGLGFDKYDYAINKNIYPFRVGFWNYDTAFVFHSSSSSSQKDNLPWRYCYESTRVSFPFFERTNARDTVVRNTTQVTMLELAIDLDSSKFDDISNPSLDIRFYGEEEDYAYIYARGSDTTSGDYESHIYMNLIFIYEDGTEQLIQSWNAISDDGINDAKTYLNNGNPLSGDIVFNINPDMIDTVGVLKLVMTDFQVAKFGDDIYSSAPSVFMSAGAAYVVSANR